MIFLFLVHKYAQQPLRKLGVTVEKIKRYRSEFYDQAIQEIAKLGVERKDDYISRVVEIGYPPTIIQRWTEKFHFDLIVMEKRGDDRLGSVC